MSLRLRALGFLPLAFFAAYLLMVCGEGRAGESLWMCHVANALLGCALLFGWPKLARIAVAWIVIGIPLWLIDAWVIRAIEPVSILSHFGGLAVGLYALSAVRMRENPWLSGLVSFLAIQQLSRWVTDPGLNVNLAHQVYEGSRAWFARYEPYWLVTTAAAAVALWGIGRLLMLSFPGVQREKGEDGVLHRIG